MFNQVVWWFWNICWGIILKFGRWFAVFLPLACWSITFMRRQDGIPVWKEWAPWGQTIWNGLRPSKHSENLRWCIMDYLHCCLCLLCLCGIGMSHTNSPPNLGRLAIKVFFSDSFKRLRGLQNLGTCRKLKHEKNLEKCMASLVGAWRFSWRFCWYVLHKS